MSINFHETLCNLQESLENLRESLGRDLQKFKNSRPKDITLNDINRLKKLNISSPNKKSNNKKKN